VSARPARGHTADSAPLLLDAVSARSSLAQAWPPFVLVAGLLLIGLVAGRDGLSHVPGLGT